MYICTVNLKIMDKKFTDIVLDFLHTYVRFSSEQEMNYALNNINGNINLLSDWGLDSLDITHFIMSLEKEYDIIITDEEAINCQTLAEFYDLVMSKQ